MRNLVLLLCIACAPSLEGSLDGAGPPPRAPVVGELEVEPRAQPSPLAIDWDARTPHASTTMVQSADGRWVFTLDRDNGTVVRLDTQTDTVEVVFVGPWPSRLTRVGERLLVSLRGARTVVELSTSLAIERTLAVGAEPMGLVARPDGERFYVAVSEEDRVLEVDAESFAITAVIDVAGGPHTLAIHPDGQRLFVGTGRGESRLLEVDLVSLRAVELDLPAPRRNSDPTVPRISGDLALRGGDQVELVVPVLYADLERPVDRRESESDSYYAPPPPVGWGASTPGVGVVTPAVVQVVVDGAGAGRHLLRAPVLLSGQLTGTPDRSPLVRSYPTALAFGGDGTLYVALEASDAVLALAPDAPLELDGRSELAQAPLVARATGAGPRGVIVAGDRLVTLDALDHRLRFYEAASLTDAVDLRFGQSPLGPEEDEGRRLFYSARDSRITSGGVSCSTCHFEGRSDGLTWRFEDGRRQTPSLAGSLTATEPVTWSGAVSSVRKEIRRTSRRGMGGRQLSAASVDAMVVFLDGLAPADAPGIVDASQVRRGERLFVESGCAACHPGVLGTDNRMHVLGGSMSNTPKLVGLASSAPYLQDGSAGTVLEVLELAGTPDTMGDTTKLTEAELADLEAYLLAL